MTFFGLLAALAVLTLIAMALPLLLAPLLLVGALADQALTHRGPRRRVRVNVHDVPAAHPGVPSRVVQSELGTVTVAA